MSSLQAACSSSIRYLEVSTGCLARCYPIGFYFAHNGQTRTLRARAGAAFRVVFLNLKTPHSLPPSPSVPTRDKFLAFVHPKGKSGHLSFWALSISPTLQKCHDIFLPFFLPVSAKSFPPSLTSISRRQAKQSVCWHARQNVYNRRPTT